MPPVPAAHKKLREARFFYDRLHESRRNFHQAADPEEFEHYWSAFLSAGRSVILVVEHVEGDDKFFKGWTASLRSSKREDDANFIEDTMRLRRNYELHRLGSGLTAEPEPEWLPFIEVIATADRSHPAYGLQFFGPPESPPPRIGRTVYSFQGSAENVLEACRRYLALLDEFIRAYDAAHP